MRVVLCESDVFIRDVIEALVTGAGHEVIGVADSSVAAVGLVEAARPDAVILDLSLDYNSDFDIIESSIAVGAQAIVFSHNADAGLLSRYSVRPTVVPKPDLGALEQVLVRLGTSEQADAAAGLEDRRRRPTRAATGPAPTGVTDAQAFYEAINDAQSGDSMISLDVPVGAEPVALEISGLVRAGDRVLAFPTAVRVFLPGGGEEGVHALLRRLEEAGAWPAEAQAVAITVRDGELGADAFARLKSDGEAQPRPIPPLAG